MRGFGRGLVGLGIVGLLGASIAARTQDGAPSGPPRQVGPFPALDPATGAVLVDLDDDVEARDADAVESRIRAAIAPYDWPAGEAAFGEELSDAANLYRLRPPPSEVRELVAALGREADVEAVEDERTWSIPETS